jgi:hypothetical protein
MEVVSISFIEYNLSIIACRDSSHLKIHCSAGRKLIIFNFMGLSIFWQAIYHENVSLLNIGEAVTLSDAAVKHRGIAG